MELAIRLADEGVPLRAIARAIDTPSTTLRDTFISAKADGRLIELPRDDWPPGFPRDQRALQLSRLQSQDRLRLQLALQHLFSLSPACANTLLALLQSTELSKHQQDDPALYVYIHHIRRQLAPHNLKIERLWGYGYKLPAEDRRQILDMVLTHLTTA